MSKGEKAGRVPLSWPPLSGPADTTRGNETDPICTQGPAGSSCRHRV